MESKILFNRANGSEFHRRIRELHIDKLGNNHIITTDVIVNSSGNIINEVGIILFTDVDELLKSNGIDVQINLIEKEFQRYLSDISNDNNPFRDSKGNSVDPNFSDRNTMLSKVLNEVCSTRDPTLFMKGAPYMENLSDGELMFLMNITQDIVNNIRAKVIDISDVDSFLSNYTPPIARTE